MTTISKLGITGIRSFDHERLEVLDFERPVTLIVGPNGSGKTTIIECLKMAATGQLPPHAKNGHGFIHDPAVAKLPEVKGQVKMLFKTGVGQEFCAIRSFQLTNRKVQGRVKPQFKALDSVLRATGDDGKKASISHRCADMDEAVPEHMGVSRAVLENVIFCHQEESSWPLLEAAAVKKRFDDIFGASRYTKALQNIRDLQREWTRQQRDCRASADLSQAHLDQATKLAAQREERERYVQEIDEELKELDGSIADADTRCQAAAIELAEHESRGVRVEQLRSLIGRAQRDCDEALRAMQAKGQDVFRETQEELQRQSADFDERVMTEAEHRVRQAKAALLAGEANHSGAIEAAQRLRGDMGDSLTAADLLMRRRAEMVERLQRAGAASVAALKLRLDTAAAEQSRAEREQRERDAVAEEALAAADREFREAELEASRNEQRAEDAQKAIRRLEEEAKTLTRAKPELDQAMRTLTEIQAALGGDGSDARLRSLDKQQEDIGRKRNDLQYSINRKSAEVTQLEAQSDAHVEVDALRKRLREAEADLGAKLADARPRLLNLLGQMPDAGEAESKVLVALQQSEEQLRRQAQACQQAQHRQSTASARRSAAETDLRKLQAEEARVAAELGVPSGGAGGRGDFAERLKAQREQVELARKDLAMTESAKHMYEKFREKSRAKNACQFCRRSFGADHERALFEECVEKLIVKIPQFLEESNRRLGEAQAELSRLDGQRPRWDRLEHLRQEIAQKQRDVAALLEEERAAQAGGEAPEREKRRLEERMQQFHTLRAEAVSLQRGAQAIEELRAQVSAKAARLLGANSKVSLQAERDELRKLHEQLSELGREEDAVRTQRDLLAKQEATRQKSLAEQKARLPHLQSQVARSADVENELTARQAERRECGDTASRARRKADAAGARARQLREQRQEAAARVRQELDQRNDQVRTLQREVDALVELESSLEALSRKVDNAEALKARLAAADEAARAAERELEGLRAKLESEEARHKKRQEVRECLHANLRLKGLQAEVSRHEAEVNDLTRQLGGRDLQALKRGVEEARQRAMELQRKRAYKEGELDQKRREVKGLEMELAGPLYNNIEQRHREAVIKHESASFAARDLGRYHAALDKALMRYHALKMEEINNIVKDLWRRVYRGRDIEYIKIVSDAEEGSEDGTEKVEVTTRVGRSYNYRVVMKCGDAEMDMRGRCSAGQRVLASLIIRLALADTFCVHCGVLALDEPTTNLDAANIQGLAEALATLIEQRRGRSRFQLILITHDEDFVNHLSRLQVCDWYYYIHKDERNCSRIVRRDVRLLAGG